MDVTSELTSSAQSVVLPSKSYEEEHAGFVTSKTGTSPIEILHIFISISITPLLASLVTPWIVPSRFIPMAFGDEGSRNFVRAIIEYPITMILPLLVITVFSTSLGGDESTEIKSTTYYFSYIIPIILSLICFSFVILNHSISKPKWDSLILQWKRIQNKPITKSMAKLPRSKQKSQYILPFLTTYRAIVIYLTVLSILAVDFRIFPRRYAKTKDFGFSLMDVGTGSFIFANGLVSSEAKRMESNFRTTFLSSIPLFILGFIRLCSVKGLEYHEVVEEYGVHWNFFFTLAFVKFFSAIVFRIISARHAIKIGLAIGIAYELLLFSTGLQDEYILNSSVGREGILNANREGLFSSIGYVSIYLLSIYVGQVTFRSKIPLVRFRDWIRHVIISGLQVGFLWIFVICIHNLVNPCSRRVGNLAYIFWSMAINYTVLWLHLVFYLVQHVLQHTGLIYGPLLFHQLEMNQEDVQKRNLKIQADIDRAKDELKYKQEFDADYLVPTDLELTGLEEKVFLLETKLNTSTTNKTDGELSQIELEMLSSQVESELASVRKKCLQPPSMLEIMKDTKGKVQPNWAYLPDLTLTPVTLDAIAYNGLAIFLLGNLLTGIVNYLILTPYTPKGFAILILWIYATFITYISQILYVYKFQIKFW